MHRKGKFVNEVLFSNQGIHRLLVFGFVRSGLLFKLPRQCLRRRREISANG